MSKLTNILQNYSSAVRVSTSHNFTAHLSSPQTNVTYFRLTSDDTKEFVFWYRNTSDSTYAAGEESSFDRPGGYFTVSEAKIGIAYSSDNEPESEVSLTFEGKSEIDVNPNDEIATDPVVYEVPEGAYLTFSWKITPKAEDTLVPCSPDSIIPGYVITDGEKTSTTVLIKPNLIAAKQDKPRILFLGDSITQGCATPNDEYVFWAARIAYALRDKYATWNIGLGYARAYDAADGTAWISKATAYLRDEKDLAVLCLGANDWGSGEYYTTERICTSIRKIVASLTSTGARLILFTLPPTCSDTPRNDVWRAVNESIRNEISKEYGTYLFDFAKVLGGRDGIDYQSICGELHPDGEGGRVTADAFLKQFADIL